MDSVRPNRILLVEDEPGLVMTLHDRLSSEGYEVETALDGQSGLELALRSAFDLIILDVMLPGKSGLDVCRDLRQKRQHVPVVMLTARGELMDKILGLKLGADDYLTKPFEIAELLARMEALLRRSQGTVRSSGDSHYFGDIFVDFRRAEVTKAGAAVELSGLEFKLLQYLIEHKGEALTRNELLDEVWGYDSMPSTRTVDVHVAWLRQKLETNSRRPQLILTVHGLGYKFAG